MGLRWQDPVDGDWDSENPISFGGGQTNLSEYCGNNPVNFIDPSGCRRQGPDGNLHARLVYNPRGERLLRPFV